MQGLNRLSYQKNFRMQTHPCSIARDFKPPPPPPLRLKVRTNTKVILVRFMTIREKQILARAIGIQKENWG